MDLWRRFYRWRCSLFWHWGLQINCPPEAGCPYPWFFGFGLFSLWKTPDGLRWEWNKD